jgi:serine/threonine protein kinase
VVERGTPPPPAVEPAPTSSDTGAVQPGAVTALLAALARTPEVAPADAWAASLHPGLVVGRFELLRELGRGGFGVVYEARDRQLGRSVAWKELRAGGALDAGGEAGLLREAEAAAQLSHPHIVQLFDVGLWRGGPYLIYELLRGEGLDARLARGALPPAEALRAAAEVAEALVHAHAAGVVHRDLKPGNVYLTHAGGAKVLDFGLAQFRGAGVEGGTPRYMAPEQSARGPQDARVDVFAAALVLRESWLGPGLDDAALRIASPLPGAPKAIEALVAAALSPSHADRPDATAWLAGLREVG